MKHIVLPEAAKSKIVEVFIQDSSSTTGEGLTGLLFDATGLVGYYKRTNGTAAVAMTMVTITTLGTYAPDTDAKCGLKEVDGTNMPGIYELHLPNDCFKAGADSVVIQLQGADNMAPVLLEFQLSYDIPDSFLTRDLSAVTATVAARSPMNAIRSIVNKWSILDTTWTIYEEDDTTVAWQSELSSLADASPLIGSDPT